VPAVLGLKAPDQPACLESTERGVEGPWAEPAPIAALDIDGQEIAVLGAVGEALKDEQLGPFDRFSVRGRPPLVRWSL
jgi:hypothetical protein